MTFLSSIKEAWGYEDESGPDTTRFPGLMEYLNQIAKDPQEYEQACQHLQEMQARVLQARLERETEYGRSESKLAVDVKELVEQNLDAYRETEVSLQECTNAFQEGETDGVLGAVESLQEAADTLQELTDELSYLHASGDPVCPRCAMPGDSPRCPDCQLDRLIPDSGNDSQELEFEQAPLADDVLEVFKVLREVVEGESSLGRLLRVLQPLEYSLLEAEAIAEEILEKEPEAEDPKMLQDTVKECLAGLTQMRSVRNSRQMRDLNQGWRQLFHASTRLQKLVAELS